MDTNDNVIISGDGQPNSENQPDGVDKRECSNRGLNSKRKPQDMEKRQCSTVSDAPEKATQKRALNCILSDKAARRLEIGVLAVITVLVVGLLSLSSLIFFVSYLTSIN